MYLFFFVLKMLLLSLLLIPIFGVFAIVVNKDKGVSSTNVKWISAINSIYFALREWFSPYSKLLKLSVLMIGSTIIIYLLGLSILYSYLLVFFITIILTVLPLMWVNNTFWYTRYSEILDLLGLFIVITVYTLTESAMTTEFHTYYPNLSHVNIFLIFLGIARIIINISFTKNERSYFDKIKNLWNKYWPYIKENPLFSIIIGIAIYLLVIFSINFCCWCIGLTPCTNSFFRFYIFILTKFILINSIISLFILIITPSKKWYDTIGMTIWLPLALIPSSWFYFVYILSVFIDKLAIMNIIQIRLIEFEQSLSEFKLAIMNIVDDMKITLSNLIEELFFLRLLFFEGLKNIGKLLITMHNRPEQVGKFLVEWANWGLDRKVYSLTKKPFIFNYTEKEWGNLWSKIRYNLARNKDNIRYWNYVKSIPRYLPVVFSLPVSDRGSYSHLLSGSLKPLFTSVYFYMKSNLNLIQLYNTMKTLGSNTYYLPLTIEGCTVEVNLSRCSLDFKLSCEGKEFKIVFGAEKIAKSFSLYNGGLNKDILNLISHRDRLLYLTDPNRLGYNPQVFMQRGLNYDQANFIQDESSWDWNTGEPSSSNNNPTNFIQNESYLDWNTGEPSSSNNNPTNFIQNESYLDWNTGEPSGSNNNQTNFIQNESYLDWGTGEPSGSNYHQTNFIQNESYLDWNTNEPSSSNNNQTNFIQNESYLDWGTGEPSGSNYHQANSIQDESALVWNTGEPSGSNYHQANSIQDEFALVWGTGEPSGLNRGTKRAWGDIGNPGSETGSNGIEVKVVEDVNGKWKANLKLDAYKLDTFSEDNTTEWKDYLEVICVEVREAFIAATDLNTTEKATIDDIFLDCDETERDNPSEILRNAIIKATDDPYIIFEEFHLLSEFFIDYLSSGLKYNEFRDTYCAENSEEEFSEGENSNNNNSNKPLTNDTLVEDDSLTPLTEEDIQSLTEDLRRRQSAIKYGKNNLLKHLNFSLDWSRNYVMQGHEGEIVHPLLTKYYQTNKDFFRNREGDICFANSSVNKLIASLKYEPNDYLVPLTEEDIQSLIEDLKNRLPDVITSGKNNLLKHLEFSLDRDRDYIMQGTEDKIVHPLLTRLYKTNKKCFYIRKKEGSVDFKRTSANKLITNLEKLTSPN